MSPAKIITFPVTASRTTSKANRSADVVGFPGANAAQIGPSGLTPGALWSAISEGRVEVHYQPQYELSSGRTIAAEALVRLTDENAGLIYPDRFIHLAEESGLIVPMGRAVVSRVCADLAGLRAAGRALERIAINVSAHQLNIDHELPGFIDRTLAEHGLVHADLELELVERQALTASCPGRQSLHALAERGCRIMIDDFGNGYSSIAYLTDLPVGGFKLDRSLINQLDERRSISIVSGLLAMAREMGLDVIAEGIETEAQHEALVAARCTRGQGFGHSRPMPLASLDGFLLGAAPTRAVPVEQP